MGRRKRGFLRYLLDTHILIWWLESSNQLNAAQKKALSRASQDSPLLVSDITLWEIATLVELGRIRLAIGLREWLEQAVAPPLVHRCSISPQVAAEVAQLPSNFHRDPADRVIVSTARLERATLMTADRRIIESQLVKTI